MPTHGRSAALIPAFRALSIALVGLAFAAGAARAQPQGPGERGACRAEIERLCADAPRGRERGMCLKKHESQLSEGCRAWIAERRQSRGARGDAVRSACKADMEALCADAEPGDRGRCLREHSADLSDACREALAARRRGPPGGGSGPR